MSQESEDLPELTTSNVTGSDGAEFKLTSTQEDMEATSQQSIQLEANENKEPQEINVLPKGSAETKSDLRSKGFCETLLENVNTQQEGAVARISTPNGLENMHKLLLNIKDDTQSKQLCNLLAQCWGASLNLEIFQNLDCRPILNLLKEFRQHADKDVRTASREVLKKWKEQASKLEESLASAKTPKETVSKPVQSVAATSIPAKPSTSVPVASTVPAKSINRPKTARTKGTKFRKTGLEESGDEEDDQPPVKKFAPHGPSRFSNSLTTPIVSKKPVNAVLSDSFKNAMASGISNAGELQRKKHPTVIDLLIPLTPAVPIVRGPLLSTNLLKNQNGPDPSRVPPANGKKRIHFADDKGEQLVYIQWIQNVLHNKITKSSDMKHADAESERNSMKQAVPILGQDEDDDDSISDSAPENDSFNDINLWHAVPYCIPSPKDFNEELIAEETDREKSVLSTFSLPNEPIESPAEPDDTSFAVTAEKLPAIIYEAE